MQGPAFADAYVQSLGPHQARIVWAVAGIHCTACVLLLESLPKLLPSVIQARLDFGTGRLDITFDPRLTSPTKQAAFIRKLGYRVQPWREGAALAAARSHRRRLIMQVLVAAAAALAAMHLEVALTAGHLNADMETLTSRAYGIASGLVSLPVLVWAALSFYRSAWHGLRLRRWNLDATISATILVAVIGSVVNIIEGSAAVYFGAITMFVALLLLGRWLMAEARLRAAGHLAMHGLMPVDATRLTAAGHDEVVAASQLRAGDQIRLQAGQQIPADCILEDSDLSIEAAVLTGEARPVRPQQGDTLPAGGAVLRGAGQATVLRPAAESTLGSLLQRVANASANDSANESERTKAKAVAWSDRIQTWYAPLVLVVALLAAWSWSAEPMMAWQVFIGLILACCPCAFGLATPLALARFQDRLAAQGVLVRDAAIVDVLPAITQVVVDKTGTLTSGQMTVTQWRWHDDLPKAERALIAAAVAGLEARSRHPLAPAIQEAALQEAGRGGSDDTDAADREHGDFLGQHLPAADILEINEVPGCGVAGVLADGRAIRIGSLRWLSSAQQDPAAQGPAAQGPAAQGPAAQGPAAQETAGQANEARVGVAIASGADNGGQGHEGGGVGEQVSENEPAKGNAEDHANDLALVAWLEIDDPIRPAAAAWLQAVRPQPITMLSGDTKARAQAVAQRLGIDHVCAEMRPEEKTAWVADAQARGEHVLMIGDGLNDAAALATADVGVSVRGALEAVLESGAVAVARDDVGALRTLIASAQLTRRAITEAWLWATLYNCLAVYFVWMGIWGPLVCAIAMPFSSFLVVLWVLQRLRFGGQISNAANRSSD
jgi:Cu2+-exporting ATPase